MERSGSRSMCAMKLDASPPAASSANSPCLLLAALQGDHDRARRRALVRRVLLVATSPMAIIWGGSWAQSQEVAHLDKAEGTKVGGSRGRAGSCFLMGSRSISASCGW